MSRKLRLYSLNSLMDQMPAGTLLEVFVRLEGFGELRDASSETLLGLRSLPDRVWLLLARGLDVSFIEAVLEIFEETDERAGVRIGVEGRGLGRRGRIRKGVVMGG